MGQEQGERGSERTAPPVEKKVSPLMVERLTHEDVPAICGLYKKVGDAQAPGLPAELIKAWQPTPLEFTSRMEGITYFAARRDGRMVGAIGCELHRGAVHLVHLGVDPDARRQGVATALVGAAVDWAKRSNAPVIWADALQRFTGAAALFQRLGFAEAGLLHKHEWAEDVRLFERVL
ncbi:MAG: N-acetyltransferase family protein [Thermoplasmata archaeon]